MNNRPEQRQADGINIQQSEAEMIPASAAWAPRRHTSST
jgi:hypothetical protein